MKRDRKVRAARGFTLIETLVVLVFLSILLTFAIPSLFTAIRQGKLRGAADQTATLMRLARLEAIKQSCTVFVRPLVADATNPDRLEGVVDCNGDGVQDDDRKSLGTIPLPSRVHLLAPPDLAGKDSVPDPTLTADPAGGEVRVALFNGDGSVENTGGFYFGDDFGNFLEVRVSPKATARIEVRKCLVCAEPDDGLGSDWNTNGEGGRAWTWK